MTAVSQLLGGSLAPMLLLYPLQTTTLCRAFVCVCVCVQHAWWGLKWDGLCLCACACACGYARLPSVVLHDFTATDEGELAVEAGEPVVVVGEPGEGWSFVVSSRGGHGVVPTSYLAPVDALGSSDSLSVESDDDGDESWMDRAGAGAGAGAEADGGADADGAATPVSAAAATLGSTRGQAVGADATQGTTHTNHAVVLERGRAGKGVQSGRTDAHGGSNSNEGVASTSAMNGVGHAATSMDSSHRGSSNGDADGVPAGADEEAVLSRRARLRGRVLVEVLTTEMTYVLCNTPSCIAATAAMIRPLVVLLMLCDCCCHPFSCWAQVHHEPSNLR